MAPERTAADVRSRLLPRAEAEAAGQPGGGKGGGSAGVPRTRLATAMAPLPCQATPASTPNGHTAARAPLPLQATRRYSVDRDRRWGGAIGRWAVDGGVRRPNKPAA